VRDDQRGAAELLVDHLVDRPAQAGAKIAVKTTSARPIIRREAVIAVRCGWRSAFSRASRPGMPCRRCSGARSAAPAGHEDGRDQGDAKIITTTPNPSSDAAAEPPAPPEEAAQEQCNADRKDQGGDDQPPTAQAPRPRVAASRMASSGSPGSRGERG
jgi:hypothetical protein